MAAFIMSGPLQAIGFALGFALLAMFLPFLGLLSNAAIGLVALRMGWQRGAMIALAVSMGLGLVALLLQGNAFGSLLASLLQSLVVVALAIYLARTASWPQLLQIIFGLAAGLVVIFHLSVTDPVAFWKNALQALVDFEQLQASLVDIKLDDLINQIAKHMTGLFAASMSLAFTLSLMLARHWQATLYNPGGFKEEMYGLRLNKFVAIGLSAIIMLALFNRAALLIDLIFVGLGLFLFQGIALVHSVRAQLNAHRTWLLALYLPLALLPVQTGLLVAVFGMVDTFADFRGYLARRTKQ
ncbi:MAG: hypothetical protein E6Q83_17360 [Thiothrix sp.]|nr:MAG: hypothetical protein E6Q83_17360 [Thiothrix sp.]